MIRLTPEEALFIRLAIAGGMNELHVQSLSDSETLEVFTELQLAHTLLSDRMKSEAKNGRN